MHRKHVTWSLPSQSIGALAAAYQRSRHEAAENMSRHRGHKEYCSSIVGRVYVAGVA
jgi:hypothetical protein